MADIDTQTLRSTFLERRKEGGRTRDLARDLGFPEAALLGACCGARGPLEVRRLKADFEAMLRGMPALGPVKAITRNETVVIEVEGAYGGVEFFGAMGQSVSGVDLRIFVRQWAHAFVVVEETRKGPRASVQYFDAHGVAIHKDYATDETDSAAWNSWVDAHSSPDQSPRVEFSPEPAPQPPRPDPEIDREGLREAWLAMKDTHEFFGLLRRFQVDRRQALRLAGRDLASPIAPNSLEKALRSASSGQISTMFFVGNRGLIQIYTGVPGRVVDAGGWLNVLDPRFNLHARASEIAEAWVVRKPTSDGVVTAIEFYDAPGEQVALLTGKRKPGVAEMDDWRALAESLVE